MSVTSSFSVDRPCLNADRSPNQDEEYDGDTHPRNVHLALDYGDHIGGHQPLGTWVHPCRLKLRVCRSQDDLTARRTTKLLLARLREPGEGFTQLWHSFEISECAWPHLAPEILGAYAYGTDGKAVTFQYNPS